MAVIAVLAFALAIAGCASPQERAGGAGKENGARHAKQAKSSKTDAAIPPLPSEGNYDCADFETRAQAKAVLEQRSQRPALPRWRWRRHTLRRLVGWSRLPGECGFPFSSGPATAAGAPPPPSARKALSVLVGLEVAPPGSMAGYSREEFPHWASEAAFYGWKEPDGSCDVRDTALIRDGEGVRIDDDCSITAGTWLDPYTGRTLTDSSEVDIDHVVPLANAWRSGAGSSEWSTIDRESYANDPKVLLSADAGANRAKGDKGPEAWKPPNQDYWCEYARRWIWIKSDWRLSVNPAEKSSLRRCSKRAGRAEVDKSEPDLPLSSTFVSTTGGVMTDEVGAITGELELLTRPTPDGSAVEAIVRYAGAQDLYTVSGSPVRTATPLERPDQAEHHVAHERILEALTTPGTVSGGNEMPVDLLDV